MIITTFNEWANMNVENDKEYSSSELPPIILNPEFVDLWKDEYEGYLDLSNFLKLITDDAYAEHHEIIRQLSERGILTGSVGGGGISNELYDYIHKKGVDNPINDYLKSHKLMIRGRGRGSGGLLWRGWVFPNSMFVFAESVNNRSFSINWPSRNPMEVKE